MKTLQKWIYILISSCLLLSGCAKSSPEAAAAGTAAPTASGEAKASEPAKADGDTWTVMLYLCGTDLETGGSMGTNNLKEVLAADSNKNVHFVVETGGTSEWHMDEINPDKLQRFHVDNGKLILDQEEELKPMTDSAVLQDFISWSAKTCPADKYMLILWDHGGGPMYGICKDELFTDKMGLTMADLRSAVKGADIPLEVVGMDACLMADLETAETFQGYAHYMVASQETSPGTGWDYTAFMNALAKDPKQDGKTIGKTIVDSFMEKSSLTDEDDTSTLSVIDLTKIPELSAAFRKMSTDLVLTTQDIDVMQEVSFGARRSQTYGYNSEAEGYMCLVDLGDLTERTSGNIKNAKEVQDALKKAVVYQKYGKYRSRASGMSVYYPLVPNNEDVGKYRTYSDNDAYIEYLSIMGNAYDSEEWETVWKNSANKEVKQGAYDKYFDSGIGDGGYSFEQDPETLKTLQNLKPVTPDDHMLEYEQYVDENGYFSLHILSGLETISTVRFELYGDNESGTTTFYGTDDDISFDMDSTTIRDNFRGAWLSIEGFPVYSELIDQGDTYNMYSVPVYVNDKYCFLRIALDLDSGEYSIAGLYGSGETSDSMVLREKTELVPGDIVEIVHYEYDFNDPDSDRQIMGYGSFEWTGDEKIAEAPLPDGDYYYQFAIRDVFGTFTYSGFATMTLMDGEIVSVN